MTTTIKIIELRGELYIKLESVCDLLEYFGDGETVDVKRLDELISAIKEHNLYTNSPLWPNNPLQSTPTC